MSSEEKLRKNIAELLARPCNVDFEEIDRILTQLGATVRKARHGHIYVIPGCTETLMLNSHNNGKSHLPKYCVSDFKDRMSELGHC